MNIRLSPTMAVALTVLSMFFLVGCQSMDYYGQALNGQYRLLQNRRPIPQIIADPQTPQSLRKKLVFILEVRRFALDALQLPVGDKRLQAAINL